MFTLHYYPSNASLAPHIILRELELPHELILVDRGVDAQKSTAYQRLNPHGRIPTLVHGDRVFYESAAICLYLSDQCPDKLAPGYDCRQRAILYQWLFFLTNTVQPALMNFHYPETVVAGTEPQQGVRARAEEWATELFGRLNNELSKQFFLLGDRPSICDFFLLMLCRWARDFKSPPRSFPHLGATLAALLERDAVRAAFQREFIEEPYV